MSDLALPLIVVGVIAIAVALSMLKRGKSGTRAEPRKPATAEDIQTAEDDVRRWAALEVAGGLTPREEIIDFAIEMAEDDYPHVDFSASVPAAARTRFALPRRSWNASATPDSSRRGTAV